MSRWSRIWLAVLTAIPVIAAAELVETKWVVVGEKDVGFQKKSADVFGSFSDGSEAEAELNRLERAERNRAIPQPGWPDFYPGGRVYYSLELRSFPIVATTETPAQQEPAEQTSTFSTVIIVSIVVVGLYLVLNIAAELTASPYQPKTVISDDDDTEGSEAHQHGEGREPHDYRDIEREQQRQRDAERNEERRLEAYAEEQRRQEKFMDEHRARTEREQLDRERHFGNTGNWRSY